MIVYTLPRRVTSVPVIDFTGASSADLAARSAIAREVHEACRDIGFFYVRGHGVPQALVDAQLDWTKRFFSLPLPTSSRSTCAIRRRPRDTSRSAARSSTARMRRRRKRRWT